jgi:hypothetical protein
MTPRAQRRVEILVAIAISIVVSGFVVATLSALSGL